MATALDDHPDWEGKRYVLTLADTAYSIAISQPAQQVTIQVEGSDDVRFRHEDGTMDATGDWVACYAGGGTVIALVERVNSPDPTTIHVATGGTAVVIRVKPEPVRGV